jgi:outer membrane lipoprotein-sorting protein
MKRYPILLLFLLLPSLMLFGSNKAQDIMEQVLKVQQSQSSALDLKLTLIEPSGTTRERRIQTLSQTKDTRVSSVTVFLSPENVRNTRFLSIEEEDGSTSQWIYLPALKRIRRIGTSEEGGSFMGSDFSYADMASTSYDAHEAEHTLLSEDEKTYIILSIPYKPTTYGKHITTVDKATYLPLLVEFYDLDQKTLLKTLKTEQIASIGGRMMASDVRMTTIASGHSTRLEILQARFDMNLPAGYFTTKFLETGRL